VENLTPHPVVRKYLMAKTWYPTNCSGFYVNGKSFYKLTDIAIHYNDVSLRLENKKWANIDPTSFQAGFWRNYELSLFMDCVTTRLQMGIGMTFSALDPEKCKEIGKIGEILFPRKCRNFFGGPRTETQFVKWSASRKRLRTAGLSLREINVSSQSWIDEKIIVILTRNEGFM